MNKRTFTFVCKRLDLAGSRLLYAFDSFDPKDWTRVIGTPKWTVSAKKITGGSPDEPTHGQIFFRKPVRKQGAVCPKALLQVCNLPDGTQVLRQLHPIWKAQ